MRNSAELIEVLTLARQIVSLPPTRYGYVDIGDTLVAYLRGDCDAAKTIMLLQGFGRDYARCRNENTYPAATSAAPKR